ncbi:MAG: TerC family protein [Pseudomonadota bacterium]
MDLFSFENLFTLMMLVMLQAVLGFDNLLYISLESQSVPKAQQSQVRKLGIALAVILRIVLLWALVSVLDKFQTELFHIEWVGVIVGTFNLQAVVVLIGGVFLLYTATKEISHMLVIEVHEAGDRPRKSFFAALTWIVLMNAVFSFDSILSAMALTDNFTVMATAIIIGGVLMIWLADRVTDFLKKNRMYEVVGLFILFLVAVMLISEGAHLAHLSLFGYAIEPLSKATFYLVIFVMVLVDIVQTRYQRKLQALLQRATAKTGQSAS